MERKAVIRAIDVGYGNLKWTACDSSEQEIRCEMAPSIANIAEGSELASFGDERDTVLVRVDKQIYEVGKDALIGAASNSTRTLDIEFPLRDTYMALARGAMSYMKVDRIDLLVLGLPVSNMDWMTEMVEERMTGTHLVPRKMPDRTVQQVEVVVEAVRVVPQPVGALIDYAVRNMVARQMADVNSLILDPGYFTLDWVVAKGMKVNGSRSGAHNNAGMSAIVRAVAESLTARLRRRDKRPVEVNEEILSRIDEYIRKKTPVKINGKVEELGDALDAAAPVIESGLTAMRAKVGALGDIDRVIIAGGAAHMYEQAVSRLFRGCDVIMAWDSVYSNVRGFQMIGEIEFKKKQAAKTEEQAA